MSPPAMSRMNRNRLYAVWFSRPFRSGCRGRGQSANSFGSAQVWKPLWYWQPVNAQYPWSLSHPGLVARRSFDFRPRHVSVPIHVPLGHGIGDSLKAEHPHQPIEDRRGVMVCDCSNEASVDCVIPQIVDPCDLASNVADPPNKRSRMPHALGLTSEWRTGVAR